MGHVDEPDDKVDSTLVRPVAAALVPGEERSNSPGLSAGHEQESHLWSVIQTVEARGGCAKGPGRLPSVATKAQKQATTRTAKPMFSGTRIPQLSTCEGIRLVRHRGQCVRPT